MSDARDEESVPTLSEPPVDEAAGVSGVAFLAVHFPAWGLVGAIPQSIFTLVIVGVYVRSRNVVACMLTHGVINVVMVLVLPAVL